MERSLTKTLARKLRISVRQVLRRYRTTIATPDGTKRVLLVTCPHVSPGHPRRPASAAPERSRPHRTNDDTGEPDDAKVSRPVRRGADGTGPPARATPRRRPTLHAPDQRGEGGGTPTASSGEGQRPGPSRIGSTSLHPGGSVFDMNAESLPVGGGGAGWVVQVTLPGGFAAERRRIMAAQPIRLAAGARTAGGRAARARASPARPRRPPRARSGSDAPGLSEYAVGSRRRPTHPQRRSRHGRSHRRHPRPRRRRGVPVHPRRASGRPAGRRRRARRRRRGNAGRRRRGRALDGSGRRGARRAGGGGLRRRPRVDPDAETIVIAKP